MRSSQESNSRRLVALGGAGSLRSRCQSPKSDSGQTGRPASGGEYALPERRLASTFATFARPRRRSELDLLRQRQGVIDFDPEVTDRGLDLRMSETQLNGSQIAGLAVDLRRLGAAHRMRAEGRAVHPRALDPAMHDARVLASR